MRALALLGVVSASTLVLTGPARAAEAPAVLEIPRVDGVGRGSTPSSWRGRGLTLDVLAGDGPTLTPYDRFGAVARLGWTADAIVAQVDVVDRTPVSPPDADHANDADAVTLVVHGARADEGVVELIVAPGQGSAPPIVRTLDHRKRELMLRAGAIGARGTLARTRDGWTVEMLIPFAALGVQASPGITVGARVTVVDREAVSGPRRRLLLAPQGQAYDFFALPRVLLGARASGAPDLAAWARWDESLADLKVNVVANAKSRASVEVAIDGKTVVTGALAADGKRASVSLTVPGPAAGQPGPTAVEVRVAGKVVPMIAPSDVAAERKRLLSTGERRVPDASPAAWASLAFDKPVFDGDAFPTVAFGDADRVRRVLGDVALVTTFYDGSLRAVQRPIGPGRYGAVVKATAADGTTATSYHTLFRRPTGATDAGDARQLAARFEAKGDASVDDVNVDRRYWHRLRKQLGTATKYEYFVRTPPGYDADKTRKWPVIFFLHGAGGGTKMENVQTSGPQVPARTRTDFPFVTVSLRSPGGWFPPAVKDVMDEVEAKVRVDKDREYLMGFSMGAAGTWDVLFDQPQRFAAASPVGGRRGRPERAAALKHLPIWVWNGATDATTTSQDAMIAVEALRAAGGIVRYTELPAAGHTDSHDIVLHGREVYDWLLLQKRGAPVIVGAAPRPRGEPPVLSPELGADGRATFRLRAPQAHEVAITGQWTKAKLVMTKDAAGLWSFTTPEPVAPGVWEYSVVIDGVAVADPSNAQIKPMRQPKTSILEVPGTPALVTEWQDVPHGTLHIHTYRSHATGTVRRVHVYTPPEYDAKASARFPVMYLLHGSGDNDAAWSVHGRAHLIVDNLLASKQAKPMVVVMTDGHPVPASPTPPAPGRDNQSVYIQDLTGDVMPLVEGRYRVQKDPAGRAIVGLSMGGAQALTAGLTRPDLFGWLGAFSAGPPAEDKLATALADPSALNAKLRWFWIGCGKDDFLIDRNRSFVTRLQSAGVRHVWRETDGDHSWPIWRRYLTEIVPQLFGPVAKSQTTTALR